MPHSDCPRDMTTGPRLLSTVPPYRETRNIVTAFVSRSTSCRRFGSPKPLHAPAYRPDAPSQAQDATRRSAGPSSGRACRPPQLRTGRLKPFPPTASPRPGRSVQVAVMRCPISESPARHGGRPFALNWRHQINAPRPHERSPFRAVLPGLRRGAPPAARTGRDSRGAHTRRAATPRAKRPGRGHAPRSLTVPRPSLRTEL